MASVKFIMGCQYDNHSKHHMAYFILVKFIDMEGLLNLVEEDRAHS